MHTEAVNQRAGRYLLFKLVHKCQGVPAWELVIVWTRQRVDNLPTFVVMTSSDKGQNVWANSFSIIIGVSGFLPSRFQGVRFRNTGEFGALSGKSSRHEPRIAESPPR